MTFVMTGRLCRLDSKYHFTTCAARVVLFSVVSVCLSANTITPEPLEISSRNDQGIIIWSKGRTSSKTTIRAVRGWWFNVSDVLVDIGTLRVVLLSYFLPPVKCVFTVQLKFDGEININL